VRRVDASANEAIEALINGTPNIMRCHRHPLIGAHLRPPRGIKLAGYAPTNGEEKAAWEACSEVIPHYLHKLETAGCRCVRRGSLGWRRAMLCRSGD